tara:strand:- start:27365 stop:27736 length:372 start_codon:yes stop_codon:yes gene_type:complete
VRIAPPTFTTANWWGETERNWPRYWSTSRLELALASRLRKAAYIDDFLPSPDEVYRRLGVWVAARARGKDREAAEAARIWRDERAATRAPARTTPCMVDWFAGRALESGSKKFRRRKCRLRCK